MEAVPTYNNVDMCSATTDDHRFPCAWGVCARKSRAQMPAGQRCLRGLHFWHHSMPGCSSQTFSPKLGCCSSWHTWTGPSAAEGIWSGTSPWPHFSGGRWKSKLCPLHLCHLIVAPARYDRKTVCREVIQRSSWAITGHSQGRSDGSMRPSRLCWSFLPDRWDMGHLLMPLTALPAPAGSCWPSWQSTLFQSFLSHWHNVLQGQTCHIS